MRKARRPTVRPLLFRLYPEPETSRLYVVAHVWPTKRAMQAHPPGGVGDPIGRGCDGTCTDLKRIDYRNGRARMAPLVAEVNFWRGRLGTEVVTHELFHATIAWGRRVGFDFARLGADDAVNADEERLTYVHGRLCRDFVARAQRAGLYA